LINLLVVFSVFFMESIHLAVGPVQIRTNLPLIAPEQCKKTAVWTDQAVEPSGFLRRRPLARLEDLSVYGG
jgi:hypothetical protein